MLPETELTILVRTCYDRPKEWERFLEALTRPDASGEEAIDHVDILDDRAYAGSHLHGEFGGDVEDGFTVVDQTVRRHHCSSVRSRLIQWRGPVAG
ncbi:DUF6924 domain-containing protein [Nocardia sp. NBC_01009]|uniref:DUF6924 domain-containing protein n=1 Tax=Nocardia sp. NBC_01009 TaxID=2975996 RepID=UPI0038674984|nr:hypothetical protein OHA42_34185 [Nocardia sp. NBC_01009]